MGVNTERQTDCNEYNPQEKKVLKLTERMENFTILQVLN